MISKKKIAIVGGGPSALFIYKKLIESALEAIQIIIFERKNELGKGMPYSLEGAKYEHITNVSDNEIPNLPDSIQQWVSKVPKKKLNRYHIDADNFNEYKVLPRLFFGDYLNAQFLELLSLAKEKGIPTEVKYNCNVIDIKDYPSAEEIYVVSEEGKQYKFDYVIICSGHNWTKENEEKYKGYFDSPYPPSKLEGIYNHPIALRGSSLTAIDAIRTLANNHGTFHKSEQGRKTYTLNPEFPEFKMMMFSRNGFLPAVRFHLEDSHLIGENLLTEEDLKTHRENNSGYVDLDFIYQNNFKNTFKTKSPEFYDSIKDLSIEEFIEKMLTLREDLNAFDLLKAEYKEAEKSIKRKQSVYWKEALAVLSITINPVAKYLSAEDMLRFKKTLMPLISVIIAFVPQSSCDVLIALYEAGVLDITSVGGDCEVTHHQESGIELTYINENGEQITNHYQTFVDCIGQPHLNLEDFPFQTLVKDETLSHAYLKFKDIKMGEELLKNNAHQVYVTPTLEYYLKVPGIAINDHFQVLNQYNQINERIYMMAVPYIGGFNPDYSGLDFCDLASDKITQRLSTYINTKKPTTTEEPA